MVTSKRRDHVGDRFGMLVVVADAEDLIQPKGAVARRVLVRCDCGAEKNVGLLNLVAGRTKSCGCQRGKAPPNATHRMTGSPTYIVWLAMRQRCADRNSRNYQKYGAKGVTVCERWQNFENFLADMGERPSGATLDRIDNRRGYEPGNCRWATQRMQQRNRTNNRWLTHCGQRRLLVEWAERTGVPASTIRTRLACGWSVDRTLSTPRRATRELRSKLEG